MRLPSSGLRRYSAWSLVRARFAGDGYWRSLWSGRTLQPAYDVVVVGAGGHGLVPDSDGFVRSAAVDSR